GRQNFASVSIYDRHHFVVAADKETAILPVHGKAAGLLAGSERPLRFHFHLVGIDGGKFAFVFDVHEHGAFGIAGSEFGFAVEFDGGKNFAFIGVDHAGILAAAVEGEDSFGGGIIEDSIGIIADFDLRSHRRERFDVENGDGAFTPVAGKAFSEIRSERDAVNAGRVGNIAYRFARLGIEDDHVRATRDENAVRIGISGEIVPAPFTSELVRLCYVVSGSVGGEDKRWQR